MVRKDKESSQEGCEGVAWGWLHSAAGGAGAAEVGLG